MSRFLLRLLTFAVLSVSAAGASRADIIWNITYGDQGSTTGFYDPVEGATRRATLTAVTQYINTIIDADGTIDLRINPSLTTTGSDTLASAGSLFYGVPDSIQDGLVFQHATTGIDPALGVEDGSAVFNFASDINWNSGLDVPSLNEYDLFSVALHELTHALGFASLIGEDGMSDLPGSPTTYSAFDSSLRVVEGSNVTALVNLTNEIIVNADDLMSGNIFFETATGALIKMYAPNSFRSGSSLSHVDLDASVMSWSIANGEMQRTYSADELAILGTLGYDVQIAAVPEPASLVLLSATAAGFGICRLRRRRSVESTISA